MFERIDRRLVLAQKPSVVGQAKRRRVDPQLDPPAQEVLAKPQQLLGAHREEANLIEEAQQPGLAFGEVRGLAQAVPHLAGAAHELVAAGALHAVDAQVRAADADRVLRGPGPRRVVLGRHQAVARIDGRRDRRAEVHVAEAQHQIARRKDDLLDVIDAAKAVDAADELDVAGAPGGVRPHRLRVLGDGQLRGGVIPGQRQVDDARRNLDVVRRRQFRLGTPERIEQLHAWQDGVVVVDVQ